MKRLLVKDVANRGALLRHCPGGGIVARDEESVRHLTEMVVRGDETMGFMRNVFSQFRPKDPVGELMRSEWDTRARENARLYIASDHWETEEKFEESGEFDVNLILSDIGSKVTADAAVLEIGCGIGRMVRPLARRFRKVYGVDVSREMIRLARARTKEHRNISLWANNGSDLRRLPTAHVDLVISYVTFQHVPAVEAIVNYIKESYRVLKPGGIFKFQVHGREDTPQAKEEEALAEHTTWRGAQFTQREIVGITESAGFRVIRSYSGPIIMYLWVVAQKPSAGSTPTGHRRHDTLG